MPIVSVIIPAFNAEKFIEYAIKSVLDQTVEDFELLVIDDGSTDNTSRIINSFTDPRLHYVYQENMSQAVARNTGITESIGTFVAFLDSDDMWAPTKLAKQLGIFSRSNVGLSYTGYNYIGNDNRQTSVNSVTPRYKGNILNHIIYDNFLPCSSVIVRRDLLIANDLFFRTGRQGSEDWDLWIRIAFLTEIDFARESLLSYRQHETNMSRNVDKMYQSKMKVQEDVSAQLRRVDSYSDQEKKRFLAISIKAKSLISLRYGHELLAMKRRKEAQTMMDKAVALNQTTPHNWWGWCKTRIYGR